MLKATITAGILFLGLAQGALALDIKSNDIKNLPERVDSSNFGERITILDIQLDEKHSFKIGGDVRLNYVNDTIGSGDREGVIMAHYKFSF